MLIFFAVTGSWQIFNWHESDRQPGGYVAPKILSALSDIHKNGHIPPTKRVSPAPVRYFMFAAAIGLITSTIIGVIMAYRFSQRPVVATLCLVIGTVLPATLLWIYH